MKTKRSGNIGGNSSKTSTRFFFGVFILSCSTILVKIIGLAYKIPMIRVLGAEGMGYFNSAFETYAMLCIVATAGLPVALTVLISRDKDLDEGKRAERIYSKTYNVFLILGLLGTLIMVFFAEPIAYAIGNPNAKVCIMAIAPSLLFVCISSAIRGYFQGFSDMMPTAVSQLIEAVFKLILGVTFALWGVKKGYSLPVVASFAALGVSASMLISTVYLSIKRYKFTKVKVEHDHKKTKIYKEFFAIAVPITLSAAVMSVTRLIDMVMLLHRLPNIGLTVKQANEIYGAYTTLAVPIFSLVPSLITPISLSLIPRLSSAIQRNDKNEIELTTDTSLRLTLLYSLPASLGIIFFSKPILSLLFANQHEEIAHTWVMLSVLGASVVFSCLITTTNALLQSNGKSSFPILSMSIGAIIKFALAYFFIGNAQVGALGAPVSTFFCDLTIVILNIFYLRYLSRKRLFSLKKDERSMVLKPFICASISIIGAFFVYCYSMKMTDIGAFCFIISLALACIGYVLLLFITKTITLNDMSSLPLGDKILKKINHNKELK